DQGSGQSTHQNPHFPNSHGWDVSLDSRPGSWLARHQCRSPAAQGSPLPVTATGNRATGVRRNDSPDAPETRRALHTCWLEVSGETLRVTYELCNGPKVGGDKSGRVAPTCHEEASKLQLSRSGPYIDVV